MKFIGFIKEQDEYSFGKSFKKYYLKEDLINNNKQEILEYLKSGKLCIALMGVAEDEDESVLGKISVYTDGEWFWPHYVIGYLEKYPNFKIEEEFIKHVLKNRNKEIILTEEEIAKLEKEFLRVAGFK